MTERRQIDYFFFSCFLKDSGVEIREMNSGSKVAFAGNLVVTLHETETLDLVQSDVLALQQLFGSFLFFTGHFHSSYFLSSG